MPLIPKSNSINEIITYFSRGIQKSNRFNVSIFDATQTVSNFWAVSTQIPEQSIFYYPETFGPSSPIINIPVKRVFDERFLIEFIVDADWNVREYFETWFDNMFSPLSQELGSNKSSRVRTRDFGNNLRKIEIMALNDSSIPNLTNFNGKFTLYEAYPKLILPSEMSNDNMNQYLTMTVDFNYRYYKFSN